jgi:flagellar basal-body rod protein FlgB
MPALRFKETRVIDRLNGEFALLQTSLALRQQRMELLATNISNADTPNYKARDFNFKDALTQALGGQGGLPPTQLALTSERHIPGQARGTLLFQPQYRIPHQPSLDGNTVEMDTERMAFADNTLHQQSDITFVSAKIKNLMSALQPS